MANNITVKIDAYKFLREHRSITLTRAEWAIVLGCMDFGRKAGGKSAPAIAVIELDLAEQVR